MQEIHTLLVPIHLKAGADQHGRDTYASYEIAKAFHYNGIALIQDDIAVARTGLTPLSVEFDSYLRLQVYVTEENSEIIKKIIKSILNALAYKGVQYIDNNGYIKEIV